MKFLLLSLSLFVTTCTLAQRNSVTAEDITKTPTRSIEDIDTSFHFISQRDTVTNYKIDFADYKPLAYDTPIYLKSNYSLFFTEKSIAYKCISTKYGTYFLQDMVELIDKMVLNVDPHQFNYGVQSKYDITANIINMIWLDSAYPYDPSRSIVIQAVGKNCIVRVLVAMPPDVIACKREPSSVPHTK